MSSPGTHQHGNGLAAGSVGIHNKFKVHSQAGLCFPLKQQPGGVGLRTVKELPLFLLQDVGAR